MKKITETPGANARVGLQPLTATRSLVRLWLDRAWMAGMSALIAMLAALAIGGHAIAATTPIARAEASTLAANPEPSVPAPSSVNTPPSNASSAGTSTATGPMQGPELEDGLQTGLHSLVGDGRPATAIEIAILLTLLSLLPAILVTVTSFTRIVIVLSFVRRALSVNELPPNPVLVGLSLFLTTFVMGPVAQRIYDGAYKPYRAGTMSIEDAGTNAWGEMSGFLVANTRQSELALFTDMAKVEIAPDAKPSDIPIRVVVPAFVLSELKTSFQMGFLLFLPFLVIDLVVSSVLLSMGMFMLPPVMISTPFKILVFVLVDGWSLVCQSLVTSFHTS